MKEKKKKNQYHQQQQIKTRNQMKRKKNNKRSSLFDVVQFPTMMLSTAMLMTIMSLISMIDANGEPVQLSVRFNKMPFDTKSNNPSILYIQVTNGMKETLELSWVNTAKNSNVHMASIRSGDSHSINTYVGHSFAVARHSSQSVQVAAFVVESFPNDRVTIAKDGSVRRPNLNAARAFGRDHAAPMPQPTCVPSHAWTQVVERNCAPTAAEWAVLAQRITAHKAAVESRRENERRRNYLNREQPKVVPTFTKVGFEKTQVPDELWQLVSSFGKTIATTPSTRTGISATPTSITGRLRLRCATCPRGSSRTCFASSSRCSSVGQRRRRRADRVLRHSPLPPRRQAREPRRPARHARDLGHHQRRPAGGAGLAARDLRPRRAAAPRVSQAARHALLRERQPHSRPPDAASTARFTPTFLFISDPKTSGSPT
jgi:hypothetical protein